MEHLVVSHLGGLYISNSDPEIITEYCMQCGDSDSIIASWNDKDEESKFKELLKYFSPKRITNLDELIYEIKCYTCDLITSRHAVTEIIHNMIYEVDINKDIINDLYSSNSISLEIKNQLFESLDIVLKKQIDFIKSFDYSQIDFDKIQEEYQRSKIK